MTTARDKLLHSLNLKKEEFKARKAKELKEHPTVKRAVGDVPEQSEKSKHNS